MELHWLKLENWFYVNSYAFSICSHLLQHCFPKISHVALFMSIFTMSFIGKGPCIILGSFRDTQKYFWDVERLLSGQNENKAFTVGSHRCLQCNSRNKINSKCREIAFLERLRMIPRCFQNLPRRDFLKTLALDHLNAETLTDVETDYFKSWFLLSQVSNSSARCWQAYCPVIVVRHLQCNP